MKAFKNKKGFGFVDSGIKILIAIVIGALLLGGIYTLTKDTILPTAKSKVESMFNYGGGGTSGGSVQSNKIQFEIVSMGTFEAEEGMTWSEWLENGGSELTGLYVTASPAGRTCVGMSQDFMEVADGIKPGLLPTEKVPKHWDFIDRLEGNDLIVSGQSYSLVTAIH